MCTIMHASSEELSTARRKRSLDSGETSGFKSIGLIITASGRKYDLQFDPEGRLAQAVFVPVGRGVGQLTLAFRAESEREALEGLVEGLDKVSH
jgi:hypothetical protein